MRQREPCVDRPNAGAEERTVLMPGGAAWAQKPGVAEDALVQRDDRPLTEIAPDGLDQPVALEGLDEVEQTARRLRGQHRSGIDVELPQLVVERSDSRGPDRTERTTGVLSARDSGIASVRRAWKLRSVSSTNSIACDSESSPRTSRQPWCNSAPPRTRSVSCAGPISGGSPVTFGNGSARAGGHVVSGRDRGTCANA